MSRFVLISKIKVQNANAIAGFTYGFPSITHFLGFVQNLKIKLAKSAFNEVELSGCAVVAHDHHVHLHGKYNDRFTQTKNSGAMLFEKSKAGKNPSIIEEGKMNMTVSLLVGVDGYLGEQNDSFLKWLEKESFGQRLAGGTILDIPEIQTYNLAEQKNIYRLKKKLLPGFMLIDQSSYLKERYEELSSKDADAEMIDAWLDFCSLKQAARPKHDLITKHLIENIASSPEIDELSKVWQSHLAKTPYSVDEVPDSLKQYFEREQFKSAALVEQWQNYINPTNKTEADWEYLPKPRSGYLVPIMVGYKAISSEHPNEAISGTRDDKTPVSFVEAAHSVGEWRGVNRFSNVEDFSSALWDYKYEENWYLCKQPDTASRDSEEHELEELSEIITEELIYD